MSSMLNEWHLCLRGRKKRAAPKTARKLGAVEALQRKAGGHGVAILAAD